VLSAFYQLKFHVVPGWRGFYSGSFAGDQMKHSYFYPRITFNKPLKISFLPQIEILFIQSRYLCTSAQCLK